ncbi:alpha/beta fold hydrolase [Rubrivivax sp. RP6-9]|uniref:alpha/beta fold hydrolase n=1 Tax=Rubrivivax sp. RP6-9 TaxID=3415750 RepID=UPI003CC6900E
MAPTPTLLPAALAVHRSGRDGDERAVCLHSSTGSHGQWRALQALLAPGLEPSWQLCAPDLHGHGDSPAWPAARDASLHVDAEAVEQACGLHAGQPAHLVGHSYGAAVALQIALRHPERVRSLTLYEPVAFGLLQAGAPGADAALDEISAVADAVAALVRAGALQDAARVFVGYWGGAAAWPAMAPAQQAQVMARMATVPRHFEALFAARWDATLLRRLRMPVLLMRGQHTRLAARRVSELLAAALPHARCVELGGAGHLGPLTHRDGVARWMLAHLDPRRFELAFSAQPT